MKNFWKLCLLLSLVFVTLIPGVFAEDQEVGPGWEKILQIKIEHPANKISFLNESYGITAGYAGECHYTLDGGKTWPRAQNNSLCRFGLEIVDDKIAWNCGNGQQVRVSEDGGRSWQEVTNCGIIGRDASFISATTGWINNGSNIVVTNNKGVNWTKIQRPDGIGLIGAMSLAEDTGYLLTEDYSVLYLTNDFGKTWTGRKTGLKADFILPVMRFINSNEGIIVAFSKEEKKEVALITVDGGTTWKMEPVYKKMGTSYITRDGKVLTLTDFSNNVVVLRRK